MKFEKIKAPYRFLYGSRCLLAAMCAVGVGCVAYGMAFKNDPVFIVGLVLVIAGYLVIRKHLKESLKSSNQGPEENR